MRLFLLDIFLKSMIRKEYLSAYLANLYSIRLSTHFAGIAVSTKTSGQRLKELFSIKLYI